MLHLKEDLNVYQQLTSIYIDYTYKQISHFRPISNNFEKAISSNECVNMPNEQKKYIHKLLPKVHNLIRQMVEDNLYEKEMIPDIS